MARYMKSGATWVVLLGLGIALTGCGHDGGGGGSTTPAPGSTTTATSPTEKPPRPAGNGNYVDYKADGFKSISWGPFWLTDPSCIDTFDPKCAGPFANSDVAADWGEPMWSTVDGGRGDMRNIKDMGANTIRLYGNDPRMNKRKFFDYADSLDIQVVEGLTGWIYNQGDGPNCAVSDPKARKQSCFEAVNESFSANLANGFMNEQYYHNALSIINLANEPDFFGWSGAKTGGLYMLAMISAFDGLLEAEKLHNVQPWKDGSLPKITCTWSFSRGLVDGVDTCAKMYGIKSAKDCIPGLVFMLQFAKAVEDPVGMTGYKPKNDLSKAFKTRWINTVQLFVPASYAISAFIEPYMTYTELKDIPVVFTEWNSLSLSGNSGETSSSGPLKDDLDALEKARKSSSTSSFYGASYFQYQIAYQKGVPERKFGLFGLGTKVITQTHPWKISEDHDDAHDLNCLTRGQSQSISDIVAAWGGKEPTSGLCDSSAWSEAVEV